MALVAGDAACLTGLANRLKTAILANVPAAQDNADLNGLCYAIATAVVAEFTTNGKAVVDITLGALQTSTAPSSPTGPDESCW